ncbi:MAG: hypothetical protein ABJA67_13490 [Chthonomonadales bacterium]
MSTNVTRRQFVSSAATVSGALLGMTSASASMRVQSAKSPALAIISCDNSAIVHRAMDSGARIVAISDSDPRRLAIMASIVQRRLGSKPEQFAHLDQIIASPRVDGLVFCNDLSLQPSMFLRACATGKDIYFHSPVANDMVTIGKMIGAVREHKNIVQTGLWRRNLPNYQRAIRHVRSGALGDVKTVRVWQRFSENSEDGTVDLAPHLLDIAMLAMNSGRPMLLPTVVTGVGEKQGGFNRGSQFAHLRFQQPDFDLVWESGPRINEALPSHMHLNCWEQHDGHLDHGVEFVAANGASLVAQDENCFLKSTDGDFLDLSSHNHPVEENLIENWISCIASRKESTSSFQSTAASGIVAHLIAASIESGKTHEWNSSRNAYTTL